MKNMKIWIFTSILAILIVLFCILFIKKNNNFLIAFYSSIDNSASQYQPKLYANRDDNTFVNINERKLKKALSIKNANDIISIKYPKVVVKYDVTPDNIYESANVQIFKNQYETYLIYLNEAYHIGNGFGGVGTLDFALADMNRDGKNELYYTYSWGSGMHRSDVAFFDFEKREEKLLFGAISYGDAFLVKVDNRRIDLTVNNPVPENETPKSTTVLGSIISNDNGNGTFEAKINKSTNVEFPFLAKESE